MSSANASTESLKEYRPGIIITGVVIGILLSSVAVVLYALFRGNFAVLIGDSQVAARYAEVASSVATVFLVIITAVYTIGTWKLVGETEKSRRRDYERLERERAEKWYEDIHSRIEQSLKRWDDLVVDGANGNPAYIQNREELRNDLDLFTAALRNHTYRYPKKVDGELVTDVENIASEMLSLCENGGFEPEEVEALRNQVDDLRKDIVSASEWYESTESREVDSD